MEIRRRTRGRALLLAVLASVWLGLGPSPARAAGYDPQQAGHPLRIIAYALHPVGVALDYLIFRPAYWLGSKEPLRTIFGVQDEYGYVDDSDSFSQPSQAHHPPPPPQGGKSKK